MTTLITAPPTVPARTQDNTTFRTNMDGFLSWMATAAPQMNTQATENNTNATNAAASATAAANSAGSVTAAAAAAVSATGYAATSSSSHSLTANTKAFVLNETGKSFALNDQIVAIRRSDPNTRMYGTISAFTNAQNWSADFAASGLVGSGGPYADWVIVSSIWAMPQAATADLWKATDTVKTITSAMLSGAAVFQTLTDATTIAWDVSTQGFNARVTLGGNRTMGAPTNLQDGVTYTLDIVQDATGSRTLAWNAIWDFGASGTPALSTGTTKIDKVVAQYSSAAGKLQANFRRAA